MQRVRRRQNQARKWINCKHYYFGISKALKLLFWDITCTSLCTWIFGMIDIVNVQNAKDIYLPASQKKLIVNVKVHVAY
ncbi:hypothetical protein NQ317_000103 [Molorchus minor]|uniref:Uncharacterized protein n=1 Tax=Molorchus minor TaxID=1323400 RepID=A0ABQ9IZW7_9CUCU|nr:hypothetical protein NQ317_000103 [Molorchus minor]